MDQTDPIADALTHWPRLATLAGLPADPPAWRVLATRGPQGARLILAVDGPALILKEAATRDRGKEGRFAQSLAAQEQTRKRLAGNTHGLSVPKLLALLPEEGLALMTRLPGDSAAALLESSDSNRDRRAVLTDCGRWLAEFHRSTRTKERPYRTRFMLDHIAGLRTRAETGALRVADPAFFLRLCAAVEAAAPRYEGQPARHAQRHGDCALENILISGARVGVVGFRPATSAPVGHDVARLLVDFAAHHAEHRKIPDGQLLQNPYRAAFFRGYDFAGPEDASVGFLTLARLAQDWATIPAGEDQRGLIHIIRLEGLRQTALRFFPDLRRA